MNWFTRMKNRLEWELAFLLQPSIRRRRSEQRKAEVEQASTFISGCGLHHVVFIDTNLQQCEYVNCDEPAAILIEEKALCPIHAREMAKKLVGQHNA